MATKRSFLLSVVVCLLSTSVTGDEQNPLPDPLTLDYALGLADAGHPDLLLQDARLKSSIAEKQRAENNSGFDVYLDLGLQEMDNDHSSIQRSDHARAGIIVTKTLYDFGRTSRQIDASQQAVESEQWAFLDIRAQRRVEILQAYFDVLLADLAFNRFNEAMATAFVAADRLRDRRDLKQVSDLAVLEAETEYERVRGLRYRSENQQRETRSKLAIAINRPDNLPSTLAAPDLDVLKRGMPEVEDLQKQALAGNFQINALKRRVAAAEQAVMAARANIRPRLRGTLEAYEYDADRGSSDEVRAELALEVPLYQARQEPGVARELAGLYAARARLAKLELDLQQAVLELWHRIEELRVKRDERAKLLEFRELGLEQSRALYEMEVKADLGNAMVNLTEAQYLSAQTDYQLALAWYKLDILTGKLQLDPVKSTDLKTGMTQE